MACSTTTTDCNKTEEIALTLDKFKFIKHGEFAKEWETRFLDGKSDQEALSLLHSLLNNHYIQCFTRSSGKILIPNSEMSQSYAEYVSQAHSWYKHTPISGVNWLLFLSPFTPFSSRESAIIALTPKDRFHYNFRTSHDCINQHASLQYARSARESSGHVLQIPSMAGDNFERFLEFWKYHAETNAEELKKQKLELQTEKVRLPQILIEIGRVCVNCMIYGTDHLLRLEGREQFEHFLLHETGVQLTKEEVATILQVAEKQNYRNLNCGSRTVLKKDYTLLKRFVLEECEYQKSKIVNAIEMIRELLYGLSGSEVFEKFYREKCDKGHFIAIHAEFLLGQWLENFAGIRESGWISDYGVEPY